MYIKFVCRCIICILLWKNNIRLKKFLFIGDTIDRCDNVHVLSMDGRGKCSLKNSLVMEKRYAVTYRRACNEAVEQIFCDTELEACIVSTLNTIEIDPYRFAVASMLRELSVTYYSHLNLPERNPKGRKITYYCFQENLSRKKSV